MLTIDLGSRQVWLDSRLLELTWTEFEILTLLSSAPMRCFGKRDIAYGVWGREFFDDGHAIESHVSRLRKKLGDHSGGLPWITTVRKAGYRLDCRECVDIVSGTAVHPVPVGAHGASLREFGIDAESPPMRPPLYP